MNNPGCLPSARPSRRRFVTSKAMDWRRLTAEATALVVAAVLCALIANAIGSSERQLALGGDYPNAQSIPSAPTVTLQPRVPMSTSMTSIGAAVPAQPTQPTTTGPPPASHPATAAVPAPAPQQKQTPSVTGAAASHSRPPLAPVNPGAEDKTDVLAKFPPHEKQPYVELHGDDVEWLYRHGALFLDARRTSTYAEGHIAGARPFSVWEANVGDKINALLAENRDQKQPIVTYCTGGDCEDSHMLAQKLWGVFFNNVYVYRDGFPDWQKRGGPIQSGPKP
jgi:rhodanese-related sulfurtransferase